MRGLGILWVLYGLLRLVMALAIFMWNGTLTLMWGALLSRVPSPFALMDYFHLFLGFALVLGIIAGLALMSGGDSARKLGLIAAFFGLINGPLGIALGAYTLVVLVPAGSRPPETR